jgi:uncharacterized membrane protein YidH (DUF202 family)
MLPLVSSAQITESADLGPLQDLMGNIVVVTNTVLIPFIIAIGFLVFVWGMFQYFIAGGANDEAKEKGKSLMIYAVLGFVLIIVFWGIINLIANSTGLSEETAENVPETGITIP